MIARTIFALSFILWMVWAVSCTPLRDSAELFPQESSDVSNLRAEVLEKILSLDPHAISEQEVKEVLSKCPAPRIFILSGSIPIVSMESFGKFLVRMGYPEASVRDPRNGAYSYSSYRNSAEMAGIVAWYYEKEGMRPMVMGHSQGGMLCVRILHELAGAFRKEIEVVNPYSRQRESRQTVTDPFTGKEVPVVGLKLSLASAIGTGKGFRFILGQWDMLSRLRKIPDTAEEFIGFHLQNDLISGTLFGLGEGDWYYPLGSTKVRNVILPSESSHLGVPLIEGLAKNEETRAWINGYDPTKGPFCPPAALEGETRNILFAAEVWFHVKKHWCLELKRWLRARIKGRVP